ncbi:recombination protein NinB [Neisseria sp. P0003.S003]|uniref:recombination protein NinB n=1 Tax=unclassified Neisseria TaxID=2623750 RepID=UPI00204E2A85|nr:MAG TPA: NinB protein [Caudoviricetes sp.]
MQSVAYRLTKDNKRPLMTTIYNNLGVWLESNAELEVCIRPYNSKRSIEQNRRLWAIYGELADKAWVNGRRYSAETWHEYCKGYFLGFELKAMPDGSELKTPISTTRLNVAEMTEYQNNIQSWAANEFKISWSM